MLAVALGVLLFLLSWQNRLTGKAQSTAAILFTLAIGLLVAEKSVFLLEYTWANLQHGSWFYKVIAAQFPILFVIAARASRMRWAATIAAGTYTVIVLFMVWILPLFPAQPKLAPIYNPVDHMVPPPFPLLLIVPAFAIDCIFQLFRLKNFGNATQTAPWGKRALKNIAVVLAVAVLFLGLSLVIDWNFSKFLLSPAAENWLFSGNRHWPYYSQPGDWQHRFWGLDPARARDYDPLRMSGVFVAYLCAVVSSSIGLLLGNWMLKVRR